MRFTTHFALGDTRYVAGVKISFLLLYAYTHAYVMSVKVSRTFHEDFYRSLAIVTCANRRAMQFLSRRMRVAAKKRIDDNLVSRSLERRRVLLTSCFIVITRVQSAE